MKAKRKRLFILGLMLIVLLCLSSCTAISSNNCYVWPVGGEPVAKELEQAGDLPNTWEWIGRLDKLRQELETCNEGILRF